MIRAVDVVVWVVFGALLAYLGTVLAFGQLAVVAVVGGLLIGLLERRLRARG